jgi:fumarate reductase subunit C
MADQIGRRPYVRAVSRTRWFFRHPRYMRYMAREVTCIFIGVYSVLLVLAFAQLAEGREAYESFMQALRTPAWLAFHALALVFSSYHSITWFNLSPRALRVQVGERFVPDGVIAGVHYALWALVSLALLAAVGVW